VIDNNGTYNLSAGQLSVDLDQELEGFFNQSGGTNTTNFLFIGGNVGSSGTYNLTAGQLTGNLFIGRFGGTGTLTQSGGLIVENSLLGLAFGLESGSGGTYNLNGGVIVLQNIRSGHGAAAFNFGGGTLQASGDFNSTLPMMLTGIGGNANVDTAGHLVTLSGQLGGAGGLNKLGTGTLDLLGNNSYTGDTNVIDGTLSEKMPCLNDLAAVRLSSDAKLDLNFTGTDAVGTLYLDGLPMALGTWGSSLSPATHIDDTHFSGSGMLNVTAVPEPSTIALLFTAAFGGLLWWRRRR
jgi:autotransporter-associated beta strand protein